MLFEVIINYSYFNLIFVTYFTFCVMMIVLRILHNLIMLNVNKITQDQVGKIMPVYVKFFHDPRYQIMKDHANYIYKILQEFLLGKSRRFKRVLSC